MSSLQLDRNLQNSAFESWKIGTDFIEGRGVLDLPGDVYAGASDAVDYLHTRAAVLRNHLFDSQGRLFVATRADDDMLGVYEVVRNHSKDANAARFELVKAAVIPPATPDNPLSATVEAALHCSLAVVAPVTETPARATGHDAAAAPITAAAEGGSAAGSSLLLVSTGRGDLVVVKKPGDFTEGVVSNVVHPLRPRPPATGVRPFTVEAAWASSSGHIRCVLAAISNVSSSSSSHTSHSNWICDTWLVTLSLTLQQQQQQGSVAAEPMLQVVDCQLLLASRSPPAAAIGCAAAAAGGGGSSSERLLIVGEPALEDEELPTGFSAIEPSSSGSAAPPAAAAAVGEGINTAPAADSNAAAAAAATAAAVAADEDLDDMDIDPRTLQQAAARLAQYTSESRLGELPTQQWTDVLKESGPGDVDAADANPTVDAMLFTTAAAAGSGGSSSSSTYITPAKLAPASSISFGPHRLLTIDSALNNSNNNIPELLLGVTDDVDCAVVAATLQPQGSSSVVTAAVISSTAATAAGADGGAVITLLHQATVPALAYVVAGKTQRRHLLLGGSSSPVCAVLVEGQKYAYLYGHVPSGSSHGKQQIVDMELPGGSSIMGARLLQQGSSDVSSSAQLLLLTRSQLICYTLKDPHS